MLFHPDDTIVAVSSAAGAAARAIVRLSGPEAIVQAGGVFTPRQGDLPIANAPGFSRLSGRIQFAPGYEATGQCLLFRGPHSYTTQDLIEFHLPGSPPLVQMLLEHLLAAGARLAEPGEFTARAFFNGRLDLTRAEAVAEMIRARSDQQLRAAERLLDGALYRRCKEIAGQLAELLALVEADIDFSDEDVGLLDPHRMAGQLEAIGGQLAALLQAGVGWEKLDHLPRVVLAGPANAGKSTLLNALVGHDRALTSALAGTTRDLVTASLSLPQGECLLIDTAGLGTVADRLAEPTQEKARRAARTCDLLLFVIDGSNADLPGQQRHLQSIQTSALVLPVVNKIDTPVLPLNHLRERIAKIFSDLAESAVYISATRLENLSDLHRAIAEHLHTEDPLPSQESLALTARQQSALEQTRLHLQDARRCLQQPGLVHEFFALELREALNQLGQVSGEIVSDDILSIIFGRFCIGK